MTTLEFRNKPRLFISVSLAAAFLVLVVLRPSLLPRTLIVEGREIHGNDIQAYYDEGSGYSEELSIHLIPGGSKDGLQTFSANLPIAQVLKIRLDPPATADKFKLLGICLRNLFHDETCFRGESLRDITAALNGIASLEFDESAIEVRTEGADPNVELRGPAVAPALLEISRPSRSESMLIVMLLGVAELVGFYLLASSRWLAIRIILAAAGTFVALLGAELILIVFEPAIPRSFYQYDPDLGFRVRPYASGSNRFGFNAPDFALEKPSGEYRVLVVNDSFGWAGGRHENYTAMMQKRFDEEYGQGKTRVINSGYPMTHTAEELSMLKKYAIQYHPDLVLLGFCAGNDYIDADPFRKRVVINGLYLDIDTRNPPPEVFGRLLIPRWRLWMLYDQFSKIRRETDALSSTDETAAVFSDQVFDQIEMARMSFYNPDSQSDEEFKQKVGLIHRAIKDMQTYVTANDALFRVAIFPEEFSVNSDLASRLRVAAEGKARSFDRTLAQKILSTYLASEQIRFVDLEPAFTAHARTETLYRRGDTHWNAAGNRLAADLLFNFLESDVPSGAK